MDSNQDSSSPLDSGSAADLQSQIEALDAQIARAQQTIRQIQNVTGTGVGNTTPARMRGGIAVPPVTSIAATVLGTTAGENRVSVSFVEPSQPTGATIDHYDIYIARGLAQQSKPTLVASTQASPAVFTFQPDGANATIITVQTVLSNGQRNALTSCPTASISASAPTINAVDLNIGGIHVGPRGTLVLNNVTWGVTGSNVSWTGAQVAYQGTSHTITSSQTNSTIIYWDAANPGVFSGSSQVAQGADQFNIAGNTTNGGIYTPFITIHDSAGRLNAMNNFGMVAYNPSGNFTVSLQARTTSASTQGRLAIGDGAGNTACILDGNGGNASNAGFVATSGAAPSLRLLGQTVTSPTPALQGYTQIQVGANTYYIQVYA